MRTRDGVFPWLQLRQKLQEMFSSYLYGWELHQNVIHGTRVLTVSTLWIQKFGILLLAIRGYEMFEPRLFLWIFSKLYFFLLLLLLNFVLLNCFSLSFFSSLVRPFLFVNVFFWGRTN